MSTRCSTLSTEKSHGFFPVFFVTFFFLLSGCAVIQKATLSPAEQEQARVQAEVLTRHAAFRAEPGWKQKIYENETAIALLTPANAHIIVSLQDQRAMLFAGKNLAIDFPVASGRKSYPTPKGSYKILEKSETHYSNLYGKIYDGEGKVSKSSADFRVDSIPEGGWSVPSPMPYWMRLTGDGMGLHVGHLPGYPASHGCVRIPRSAAPKIYRNVKVGTPVEIVAFFDPDSASSIEKKR